MCDSFYEGLNSLYMCICVYLVMAMGGAYIACVDILFRHMTHAMALSNYYSKLSQADLFQQPSYQAYLPFLSCFFVCILIHCLVDSLLCTCILLCMLKCAFFAHITHYSLTSGYDREKRSAAAKGTVYILSLLLTVGPLSQIGTIVAKNLSIIERFFEPRNCCRHTITFTVLLTNMFFEATQSSIVVKLLCHS